MVALIEAPSTIGSFYVSASTRGVVGVTFPGVSPERHFSRSAAPFDEDGMDIATTAANQIRQFIAKEITQFTVAVDLFGERPFRRAVYEALRQIPYGDTVTYGELAIIAGHPGAARAVGAAMKNNPVPLIIPCHRVVGAGNAPGGWSGPQGLKELLLDLEQSK